MAFETNFETVKEELIRDAQTVMNRIINVEKRDPTIMDVLLILQAGSSKFNNLLQRRPTEDEIHLIYHQFMFPSNT